MIEKLLLRLSRLGSTGDTLSPRSSLPPGAQHGLSSLPRELQQTLIPLAGRSASDQRPQWQPPGDWQTALDAYQARQEMPVQPLYFKAWTAAHVAVALRLWQEREHLHMGVIELFSATGVLVASVYPPSRRVLINPKAYQGAGGAPELLLRQQPEQQTQLSMPSAAQFEVTHLHGLLWFLGQRHLQAASLLPFEFDSHRIELRRFPLIEPAALDVRHITLLYLFSAGAQSFAQLKSRLSPEQAQYVCADLSSLYFTGALKLLPPEMTFAENHMS